MTDSSKQALALWTPALRPDPATGAIREDAGPRERSLVRLLAAMLGRRGRVVRAVVPRGRLESGRAAWLVATEAWTAAEARAVPEVEGCGAMAWGSADLSAPEGEPLRADLRAMDRASGRIAWEGSFERPRSEAPAFVAGLAAAVDGAFEARGAGTSPETWLAELPTRDAEALLEFLAALDVYESLRWEIATADPSVAMAPVLRVIERDPECTAAPDLALDTALRSALLGPEAARAAMEAVACVAELRPALARADAVLAECALRAGDPDVAREHALRYARRSEGKAAALGEELAGRAFEAKAEPSQAASCFRRAVQLDPRRAASWHRLGALAAQLGRFDEAEICFAQSVAIAPDREDFQDALRRARGELMRVREQRGPLVPPPPPPRPTPPRGASGA